MTTRRPAYDVGGPDLRVVMGEVHAVAGRRQRLGHADGHDQRVGLVAAVAGLDDEAAAVAAPGRDSQRQS